MASYYKCPCCGHHNPSASRRADGILCGACGRQHLSTKLYYTSEAGTEISADIYQAVETVQALLELNGLVKTVWEGNEWDTHFTVRHKDQEHQITGTENLVKWFQDNGKPGYALALCKAYCELIPVYLDANHNL